MVTRQIKPRDVALNSEDLAVCDRVLAELKREFALSDDSEEVERSAAIIIELFERACMTKAI